MNTLSPADRLAAARLALDGLSVGDAFGERFFVSPATVEYLIEARAFPEPPWDYTDDTEMALAIVATLEKHARIDQDALAREFARRYRREPARGYGGGAHAILSAIGRGEPWRDVSRAAFSGMGSMGNGGAMRAAPVGAYFADDTARVVSEARASAEVTHAHPEGQAGAIAVALAAAFAWRTQHTPQSVAGTSLVSFVLDHLPDGETRAWLDRARALGPDSSVRHAAAVLGTGARVISADTVPFALFCAERYLTSYVDALWATVSGLGDRDTTCAIVGGIVALAVGPDGLPDDYLGAREPLAR